MKKKLLYLATFFLLIVSFSSCEKLKENCETCRYNTYVNGVFANAALEAEYCGADLIARKAAPDVITGEGTSTVTVTKFECD